MNNFMKQPTVTEISKDNFIDLCRKKWTLYCHNNEKPLKQEDIQRITKCFQYIKDNEQLYEPIQMQWEGLDFIFLTLIPAKFESDKQKIEFIRIIRYIMKLDLKMNKEAVLDLNQFFKDYQATSKDVLPFIQLFAL